jgi:hypothetical protein
MYKEPLTTLELRIIEQFGKIVKKFRILHHGWDMDGYGYIVADGKINKIVTTDHGKPFVVDSSYLNTKIREYGDVILEIDEAIKISKNEKN